MRCVYCCGVSVMGSLFSCVLSPDVPSAEADSWTACFLPRHFTCRAIYVPPLRRLASVSDWKISSLVAIFVTILCRMVLRRIIDSQISFAQNLQMMLDVPRGDEGHRPD